MATVSDDIAVMKRVNERISQPLPFICNFSFQKMGHRMKITSHTAAIKLVQQMYDNFTIKFILMVIKKKTFNLMLSNSCTVKVFHILSEMHPMNIEQMLLNTFRLNIKC